MVRSIKLVGLAFVAMLALGAVMASAASATPLIRFTNLGLFLTATSGGSAKLETLAGHEVTCTKTDAHGNVVTEDRAHILIEFLTCTEPKTGATCTTTEGGSEVGTKGNIHVLALALLGSDTAPPLDLPAVLVTTENSKDEPANTTFRCALGGLASNLEVRGSVIGLALNIATPTKCEMLFHFNKSSTGMQQDTKFWDESKTNVETFLETKSEGVLAFGFEQSSEEAEATLESGTNKILIAT
jgi:hypothetical protein